MPTPTVTTDAFKNDTDGTVLTSLVVPKVWVIDMTSTPDFTNVTTNSTTGVMTLTSGALVAGHNYLVVSSDATGVAVGVKKFTAA